jgi:hypothetical protein
MRQGRVSRIASVEFATGALYLFSASSNLDPLVYLLCVFSCGLDVLLTPDHSVVPL